MFNSKMSHPRYVYINSRCSYQSITQQYQKSCLIKDDSNYVFRPIAAIITYSSVSVLVVLCMVGMVMWSVLLGIGFGSSLWVWSVVWV